MLPVLFIYRWNHGKKENIRANYGTVLHNEGKDLDSYINSAPRTEAAYLSVRLSF